MRYGYIGLGNLGGHLAASLLREGFEVTVHDKDRSLADRHLAAGGIWADSPGAMAELCDTVITCLPSPAISEAVLDQLLAGLKPGATWIEMSTLGRDEILRLSKRAAEKGVRTMECPVTGGVHLAAQGRITCLAGGDEDLFELHKPALQAMGDRIFHMGPLGSAAVIKVITNMLAFIDLVGLGEALMLAERGGLDLAQSYRAIRASSGNSVEFETVAPVVLSGTYNTGFTLALGCKDLGFVTELGRQLGVPLEMAGLVERLFFAARDKYGADAWTPHVVKMLEEATGTALRAPGFPEVMTEANSIE